MRRLIPLLALCLVGAGGDRPSLVDAAKNADKEAVRTLLKQGAGVNAAEADGTTALHWASYRDDLESADLLIRAGAKVNAANDLGATPLWTACQNANAAMVRRLLQAGANPNAALLLGETVLMAAAHSGNSDIVEQLIAKGANVNARAARGQTALMWSVGQKHSAVVKVLLAHGADVLITYDIDDFDALLKVADHRDEIAVRLVHPKDVGPPDLEAERDQRSGQTRLFDLAALQTELLAAHRLTLLATLRERARSLAATPKSAAPAAPATETSTPATAG